MKVFLKLCLLLFVIPISIVGLKAQDAAHKYIIKDFVSQKPISKCKISYYIEGQQHQQISDENGCFFIQSNSNDLSLKISHIGYLARLLRLKDLTDSVIYLKSKDIQLKEVTVYSSRLPKNKGNIFWYTPVQASSDISVVGEPDVLRHISSVPGVSQGVESTLGLFVRGANNSSNGQYFNSVPMYVTTHAMGMLSVYPSELIDRVAFYMGGIPASKGNFSSSLLDVSAKNQLGSDFQGSISISPYFGSLYASVPLLKKKLSLQVSGRSSLLPYLVNLFYKSDDKADIKVHDIYSVLNFKASEKNFFDALFFYTNDYFALQRYDSFMSQGWGAYAAKMGWRCLLTDKLDMHLWSYYTKSYSKQNETVFDEETSDEEAKMSKLEVNSGIQEWSLNGRLKYILSEKFVLSVGGSLQDQTFFPGNEKFVKIQGTVENKESKPSRLTSFFVNSIYKAKRFLHFQLGYRHTTQRTEQEKLSGFDFHGLSHVFLNENWGLELSYDKMNQYYHVLEGLPTGWSMNISLPSSSLFPEEKTQQYYGGLFFKREQKKSSLSLSMGVYFRKMKNLLSYISAINAFGYNSSSWKENVDLGRGQSRGLELSAAYHADRFETSLAYTLSKTDRTYTIINGGKTFPFKFDRRHILNLQAKQTVSSYKNKKGTKVEHALSAGLRLSSGNRLTVPIGSYQGYAPPYWEHMSPGHHFPPEFHENIYDRQLMSGKNAIKMKNYFRVDLGYSLKKAGRVFTNEFTFSIFNVFNRHNPYTYFQDQGEWKQLSIVPIMPSIRYSLRW